MFATHLGGGIGKVQPLSNFTYRSPLARGLPCMFPTHLGGGIGKVQPLSNLTYRSPLPLVSCTKALKGTPIVSI